MKAWTWGGWACSPSATRRRPARASGHGAGRRRHLAQDRVERRRRSAAPRRWRACSSANDDWRPFPLLVECPEPRPGRPGGGARAVAGAVGTLPRQRRRRGRPRRRSRRVGRRPPRTRGPAAADPRRRHPVRSPPRHLLATLAGRERGSGRRATPRATGGRPDRPVAAVAGTRMPKRRRDGLGVLVRSPLASAYRWRKMVPTTLARAVGLRFDPADRCRRDGPVVRGPDRANRPGSINTVAERRLVEVGWSQPMTIGLVADAVSDLDHRRALSALADASVSDAIDGGGDGAAPPFGRSLLSELARHSLVASAAAVGRVAAGAPRAVTEPLAVDARRATIHAASPDTPRYPRSVRPTGSACRATPGRRGQAVDAIIGRHDRRGIEAGGIDQPKPQLTLGPAAAGARKAGRQIALELLFGKWAAVAEDASA